MKNPVRFLGIIFLMVFSFYYTEKIAIFVQNKTPLKQKIMAFKSENIIPSINATINGDFIIPGINGLEVDASKSFNVMKNENDFNESEVVYKEVSPKVSLYDNKDKIIIKGNSNKKAVAFIVSEDSNKLINYLNNKRVDFSYLSHSKYCFYELIKNCDYKYKVKLSYIIDDNSVADAIKNIKSGDILYLHKDLNNKYVDILINKINFYNYKIVSIDELLSEKNTN